MASGKIPATAKPIADAFAEFQGETYNGSLPDMCGKAALDAINAAAQKPRFTRPSFDTKLKAGIALSAVGLIMVLASPWPALGYWIFVASQTLCFPALVLVARSWKDKSEPSLQELLSIASGERQKQNVKGLDDFKKLIADGEIPAYVKFNNGSSRRLNAKELRCFEADHGRLLVISNDLAQWFAIRSRPLPSGEIWVDVASYEIISKPSARNQAAEPILANDIDVVGEDLSYKIAKEKMSEVQKFSTCDLIRGMTASALQSQLGEFMATVRWKSGTKQLRSQVYHLAQPIINAMPDASYKEIARETLKSLKAAKIDDELTIDVVTRLLGKTGDDDYGAFRRFLISNGVRPLSKTANESQPDLL
jgi:hypothetical protein